MNAGRAGRFLAAGAVAFASAFVVAITLAVVDLYLSGHGLTRLGGRRLADVDALGVHLSVADAMLLMSVALVFVVTARVYRK